jgi:hypothetical protein
LIATTAFEDTAATNVSTGSLDSSVAQGGGSSKIGRARIQLNEGDVDTAYAPLKRREQPLSYPNRAILKFDRNSYVSQTPIYCFEASRCTVCRFKAKWTTGLSGC